jgi:glycosyltransferase involved in cell wall biosynthesis
MTGPPPPRPTREPTPSASESTRPIERLSGLRVLVAHPGAELYGSDRVVLESVAAMTGAGAVVEVTLPETGPLVERLERVGATVVPAPALVLRKRMLHPRNWPSAVATAFRALRASRRLLSPRPDVVYVNTVTLPLWPILARMRGIPVLTHIHEAEASTSRLMLVGIYAPHLLSTATIANSEFSRSIIARASTSLAHRTRVIYNGVAGPVSATPARVSLEGSPVRLTYLGRLSPRKGTDLVITAAAELVDDGVDVDVDLLGEAFDGYEWFVEALHRAVAAHGLESRVRFLGFRDDVWAALRLADIVVIPSTAGEPFGNTAVEAALAARPLVVSESSGLLEATHGLPGVHGVPPGDASAIADAVRDIIAHWPEQRVQADASARVAALRFDPERYRTAIVDLIASLTDRPASSAGLAESGGATTRA